MLQRVPEHEAEEGTVEPAAPVAAPALMRTLQARVSNAMIDQLVCVLAWRHRRPVFRAQRHERTT
jgi:hypothetical protein